MERDVRSTFWLWSTSWRITAWKNRRPKLPRLWSTALTLTASPPWNPISTDAASSNSWPKWLNRNLDLSNSQCFRLPFKSFWFSIKTFALDWPTRFCRLIGDAVETKTSIEIVSSKHIALFQWWIFHVKWISCQHPKRCYLRHTATAPAHFASHPTFYSSLVFLFPFSLYKMLSALLPPEVVDPLRWPDRLTDENKKPKWARPLPRKGKKWKGKICTQQTLLWTRFFRKLHRLLSIRGLVLSDLFFWLSGRPSNSHYFFCLRRNSR